MNKTLIAALAILSVGSVFSQESRFFVSDVNSHEMKKQAEAFLSDHNALLDKVLIINEYSDLFLDPTGDGKTYMIKEPMCHDIKSILGDVSKKYPELRGYYSFMLEENVLVINSDCVIVVMDRAALSVPQDPPKRSI